MRAGIYSCVKLIERKHKQTLCGLIASVSISHAAACHCVPFACELSPPWSKCNIAVGMLS